MTLGCRLGGDRRLGYSGGAGTGSPFSGGFMAYRSHVNKRRSAGKFRRNVSRTKSVNMRAAPMRGGIRL